MSTEPGAPSLKQLRILIADHDPVSATQTEAALRRRLGTGAQFTRSATLAQTIRAMLDTPQDAVLLELGLPDAGGIASVVGVRSAAPLVPIVVHTAVLDDMLALRALRAGAQECTEKGMAPESLVRMLGFAIERQRRLAMLEAARVEAAHRATHDPLTGLANRELFQDQLERALAFGSRYNRKTGLIFVDLDGFKAINDTRGHALGDLLLKVVAGRLLECVRRSDAVARLGGDEFVVLLPDVTSRRDVAFVKDCIIDAFRTPIQVSDSEFLTVEASIGGAMSPLDGAVAQDLLDAADADMYREKYQRRRGRAHTPTLGVLAMNAELEPLPSAAETVSRRREARLRAAMGRGEFEVHFQPVLDVIGDRVIAAEALLRWRDPDRGLISPTAFLSLAEDTGLIVPIGEQVLEQACRAIVQWRLANAALGSLRVAVNLSAVQLREHGFERRVAQVLATTGCPPDALTLELTESSTMVDGETAMETLRALKGLGLRLVVDDFGVGHASLTFLREAPVDGIKIDRRFVSQLMVDPRDMAIVSGMVRLARGLGLEVTAEGVETAEQSQRLARLQCFAQQGRHFSDALPLEQMTGLLHSRIGSSPRSHLSISRSSTAFPRPAAG
ncbi:MAG TPA: GGDEF domain-containing response regulator [Gemmatimonas aurantiaca]|uniref:GGDEF domain-containing response regulator n=2 Tax=Gemmatimonas aurantiaca TaxID=173480 RepID=A0A3D4V9P1_9BACT|nr:EAL domain-containing protein [Gemmatimonas aurantiaca]BAH39060.1 putative response regulator [Gemmatimonas aurantiaca T-27]HCT57358.1 GGDEF domain-containing response regulator [Gemmatimonas aurantiaca]